MIENRLIATEKWLSQVENNKYSIQLFLTRTQGREALAEFLGNVPESLDFNKIYIYETLINNNSMYSVIYDEFASYSKAVKRLNDLTDDFEVSKPFIRRVRDLPRVSDLKKDSTANESEILEVNVTLNNSVNR